jgi:translocation and assembly module TamB
VVLKGEPLPGKEGIPPFDLNVQARGDGRAITVESLAAKLPGITAQLSGPVTIERNGLLREGNARFAVEADLAEQPWFAAKGRLRGEARMVSGVREAPNVEFQFEASDVLAQQLSLSAVNARGRFSWPQLQVASATVVGGEGERLELRGSWDFREKEIQDGAIEGQIRRRSLARWLPPQPEFDVVRLKAEVAGAADNLQHHGTAEAEGLKVRGVNPVTTAVEWRGRGASIESFSGTATAGTTTVRAEGAIQRSGLALDRLELSQGATRRLSLTEKATLRWRPTLQFESVHLAGPEGRLDGSVTWGDAGRIEVSARNLDPAWIEELIPRGQFKWRLALLAVTGTWDRGPLTFSISGGAEIDMGNGHTAAVNAAARGSKDGIQVEALRATEGDATVFNASGAVPVVIHPRGKELIVIEPDGPVTVDALAAPHAIFWEQLAQATGIELKDPQASARVQGTWLRPQGELRLAATRVAIDPARFKRPLPELSQLDVRLTGARDGVRLETFSLQIEGQALRAQGRLPVPDGQWREVVKPPFGMARRGADLRVEIPGADLAAFARFLPAYVAPKGQLRLDVTYRETKLDGSLHLRDAASRPLGPLGVLQEINAEVRMAGRALEFHNVGAKSGGQPVTLTGKVELPETGQPRFDLTLRGSNLPFVRQAGLLVRGDLDLKLQTPPSGPPRIAGSVRLRDSLFLSDVRSFLPQGAVAAVRRPPYFAIETPPLNAWGLAVEVAGDRFLRLRTPVFSGVASARFRLTGTLGEPRAIGEATVDEGIVLMPFASFEIRQGAVRLTEANPFEPTIFVRGTGRRFGYDLTMELDGSPTSPNVILSSSPALDSEQVLLMVMTGAPPTNDITFSATQRVTRIGTFLGQSLLGSLGTDAANADRLSIASGEKISKQGKETYEIEYKLSDRLTVSGEYNEFDEHSAGVKWRIFPKKKGSEEVQDAAK